MGPVAAVDKVGVAVDQAGGDPAPPQVMNLAGPLSHPFRQVGFLAQPGDLSGPDSQSAVPDRPVLLARNHGGQVGLEPQLVDLSLLVHSLRQKNPLSGLSVYPCESIIRSCQGLTLQDAFGGLDRTE